MVFITTALVGNSQTPLYLPGGQSGIGTNSSNNNVGIGISSPQYFLEVRSNISSTWLSREFNDANSARTYLSHGGGFGAYINAGTNATGGTYALQVTSDNASFLRPYLYVRGDGNVGLGTSSPAYKLDVTGDINFAGDLYSQGTAVGCFSLNSGSGVIYYNGGNVGIGTSSPSALLTVNGDIKAERIDVVTGITMNGILDANGIRLRNEVPASDHVFNSEYQLMSLKELDEFIKTNRHLPEVPSAEEFRENGYSVGEMDDLLLRKIEELTLYIIEIKKSQEALETENRILKQQMNRLGISE